jgi:hypothetical protein
MVPSLCKSAPALLVFSLSGLHVPEELGSLWVLIAMEPSENTW